MDSRSVVRAHREADVTSDCNLLVAVVSLKLHRAQRSQQTTYHGRGESYHQSDEEWVGKWSRWSYSRNAQSWRNWSNMPFDGHIQRDMGEQDDSWSIEDQTRCLTTHKGWFGWLRHLERHHSPLHYQQGLQQIIHTRLAETLDEYIRQEQAAFCHGRSCSDHIFTLRQILEQSKEWNAPPYANFIHFEKVFDSIYRHSLWKILRHYRIPCNLVNVIKMIYSDFKSQVICNTALIDVVSAITGVKQECILSPFLFILGSTGFETSD